MSLKNALTINILLNTKAPTIASFGRSLIFGKRAAAGAPAGLLDTSRIFSEPAEMLAAGYVEADPEYKAASAYQSQVVKSSDFIVHTADEANGEEVSLNNAKSQIDFYGLMHTSRLLADLHAAGDWALANEKLLIGGTDDVTIGANRNNIREAYFLHSDNSLFAESRIAGLCFPQDIGSITWMWQEPAGISIPAFDATQINTIETNKTQTFEGLGGFILSNNGVTTGGQFIDIIQISDYLHAKLFQGALMKFVGGTLGFDFLGSFALESGLREVFDWFGKKGLIAAVDPNDERTRAKSDMGLYQYILTMPQVNDIPTADRAARKFTGIEFSATLTGKMHSADVNGTMNV
jgi:hypothetical protein